jgi:hypothetical protein
MTRFDLPRVRLRELERLLKERRGECVPLCEFLAPMARCFRQNLCNLGKPAEVADIAERFHAHHYEYPAPGFTKAHFETAAKGGTGPSPTNLYNGLRPACATVWHGSKESGLPREDPLSGTDRARAITPVQRTGRRGTPDGVADADRPTRDGAAGLRP